MTGVRSRDAARVPERAPLAAAPGDDFTSDVDGCPSPDIDIDWPSSLVRDNFLLGGFMVAMTRAAGHLGACLGSAWLLLVERVVENTKKTCLQDSPPVAPSTKLRT